MKLASLLFRCPNSGTPNSGCGFFFLCVYLESAVIKEHHEGAVGLQPLQQIESGHVYIRHTSQVPTLRKQKVQTAG